MSPDRTPEEREAARLERERKRATKGKKLFGRSKAEPAEPPAPAAPLAAEPTPPPDPLPADLAPPAEEPPLADPLPADLAPPAEEPPVEEEALAEESPPVAEEPLAEESPPVAEEPLAEEPFPPAEDPLVDEPVAAEDPLRADEPLATEHEAPAAEEWGFDADEDEEWIEEDDEEAEPLEPAHSGRNGNTAEHPALDDDEPVFDPDEEPIGVRRVYGPKPEPPDDAPAKPQRSRGRRLGIRIVAVVVILLIAGAAWFAYSLFQPGKGGGHGSITVKIPDGSGARQIGDLLARKGVVSSGFLFSLRATLSGDRDALRSGSITLKKDMSYASALTALTTPPTAAPVVNVPVPPGKSIRESAPGVKNAGVKGSYVKAAKRVPPASLRAPKGTHTLEGLLFPATYELKKPAQATDLVKKQLATFKQNLAKVDLSAAKKKNLTPYDVVTIASLIDRETGRASDRPKISAVVYNRLHKGMPLQIDASLRYGLNDWTHALTQSDLASSNPYNLAKKLGLPPTPIGNPSLPALQAAAHPAKAPYVYFVARAGTCGSVFFSDYNKFLKASAAYQAAQEKAQRTGKKITTCAGG